MTTQYQDVVCSLAMPDLSRYCRFIPATLPSLPLNQKHQLPSVPAVYFALGEGNEVLYIGKSVSLFTRWVAHHRLPELQKLGNVRLAWIELETEEFLGEVERVLIDHFSPKLNGLRGRTDTKPPKKETGLSWLSLDEAFWAGVMSMAEKHGMSSKDFLRRCVRYFDEYLESEDKPSRKYLTSEQKQHVKEAHSILTKRFWDKLTPEEKKARAQVAANARWAKKKETEAPEE